LPDIGGDRHLDPTSANSTPIASRPWGIRRPTRAWCMVSLFFFFLFQRAFSCCYDPGSTLIAREQTRLNFPECSEEHSKNMCSAKVGAHALLGLSRRHEYLRLASCGTDQVEKAFVPKRNSDCLFKGRSVAVATLVLCPNNNRTRGSILYPFQCNRGLASLIQNNHPHQNDPGKLSIVCTDQNPFDKQNQPWPLANRPSYRSRMLFLNTMS